MRRRNCYKGSVEIRRGSPGHRGYALFTGMVFLVIVTSLAIYIAKQSSSLHFVSANFRAKSLAEAGAEAAIRRAERWLYTYHAYANGVALVGDENASSGVYNSGASHSNLDVANFMRPRHWSDSGAVVISESDTSFTGSVEPTGKLENQPVYMIQDLGPLRPAGAGSVGESGVTGSTGYEGSAGISPAGNSEIRIYLITGKSTGPTRNSVVTVQSTFAGRTKG